MILPVDECMDFDMHEITMISSAKHCLFLFHNGEQAPTQLPIRASRVVIADGKAENTTLLSVQKRTHLNTTAKTFPAVYYSA